MTREQESRLSTVLDRLDQCRQILDYIRFGEEIEENEFNRLQEAFNLICETEDKIYG